LGTAWSKAQDSRRGTSYLLDVLALKLGDELVETVRLGVDANRLKNSLDVGGSGGLVAAELEEEVCGEVLHFCGCWRKSCQSGGFLKIVVVARKAGCRLVCVPRRQDICSLLKN